VAPEPAARRAPATLRFSSAPSMLAGTFDEGDGRRSRHGGVAAVPAEVQDRPRAETRRGLRRGRWKSRSPDPLEQEVLTVGLLVPDPAAAAGAGPSWSNRRRTPMRRLVWLFAIVAAGLMLGAPGALAQDEDEEAAAEAQEGPQGLTMQMSNNWMFQFAGNVNAFLTYTNGERDEDEDVEDPGSVTGGLINPNEQTSRIRTGLLPAFAVFDAKGREGNTDLGVHFGFAPQIQTPGGPHDNFGNGTQAGAQIDMRQVFATFGGEWGQILFGREIGLYQRQNILTDMTLFGVGTSGGAQGAGGTTLGRIGVGYIYPNFNAQMTYSTPAGRPFQLSLGLFDPSFIGDYEVTKTPRLEGELTYSGEQFLFWLGGLMQNAELALTEGEAESDDVTAIGGSGGIRVNFGGLSLVGSGYVGEGVGTTLMFNLGVDDAGNERRSYGYIGQATYTAPGSQWTFGASIGDSRLERTDEEEDLDLNGDLVESNRSIVGTIVYQATKSLKAVVEYAHSESESHDNTTFKEDQGAFGFMLFF
jgi:predicted porin